MNDKDDDDDDDDYNWRKMYSFMQHYVDGLAFD